MKKSKLRILSVIIALTFIMLSLVQVLALDITFNDEDIAQADTETVQIDLTTEEVEETTVQVTEETVAQTAVQVTEEVVVETTVEEMTENVTQAAATVVDETIIETVVETTNEVIEETTTQTTTTTAAETTYTLILDEETAALADYSLEIVINYMGSYASMKTNELRQVDISQIDQLMEDLNLSYINPIEYALRYDYVKNEIIDYCYIKDVVVLGIGGDESYVEMTFRPDYESAFEEISNDDTLTEEEKSRAITEIMRYGITGTGGFSSLFSCSYTEMGKVTLNFTDEEPLVFIISNNINELF